MDKRLKAIQEYYNNLIYGNHKQEALMQITALSEKIIFQTTVFADRLLEVASIIEKYSFLFKRVCKHVDIVTTMIECLTYNGTQLRLVNDNSQYTTLSQQLAGPSIILLLKTIFDICKEKEVETFLRCSLTKDFSLIEQEYITASSMIFPKHLLIYVQDMILLEDADLYAVINCLKILDKCLNNIWVHESIRQDFLSLMDKHHFLDFQNIHLFRLKKDLLFNHKLNCISITSIWSEDIIAAKNLASLLNRHVIFINAHMYLHGTQLSIPYIKLHNCILDENFLNTGVNKYSSHFDIKSDIETVSLSSLEIKSASTYNLFYDGMWQEPAKGIYWKFNNVLWANATSEDIMKCINSAKIGYEVWSAMSADSRMQVLSTLASILENNGKSILATIISRIIKFQYLCEGTGGNYFEGVELINARLPRGIIILREVNENVFFFRLMQILIAGNSVIVICNEKFYNPIKYYNLFSTCKIPPGVINLLSNHNLRILEKALCGNDYEFYANCIFSSGTVKQKYFIPCIKLTCPKQILLPLK